jgi:hypothetical protein
MPQQIATNRHFKSGSGSTFAAMQQTLILLSITASICVEIHLASLKCISPARNGQPNIADNGRPSNRGPE